MEMFLMTLATFVQYYGNFSILPRGWGGGRPPPPKIGNRGRSSIYFMIVIHHFEGIG